jgi:hypothetical protein
MEFIIDQVPERMAVDGDEPVTRLQFQFLGKAAGLDLLDEQAAFHVAIMSGRVLRQEGKGRNSGCKKTAVGQEWNDPWGATAVDRRVYG